MNIRVPNQRLGTPSTRYTFATKSNVLKGADGTHLPYLSAPGQVYTAPTTEDSSRRGAGAKESGQHRARDALSFKFFVGLGAALEPDVVKLPRRCSRSRVRLSPLPVPVRERRCRFMSMSPALSVIYLTSVFEMGLFTLCDCVGNESVTSPTWIGCARAQAHNQQCMHLTLDNNPVTTMDHQLLEH